MKRLGAFALALVLLLALPGCKKGSQEDPTFPLVREGKTVGISLPEESWETTATALKTRLEILGYQTVTEYAQASAKTQAEQITAMAANGVDCIIVAAVDALTLAQAADYAAAQGAKLIAYDSLILDTPAISYYISPDYRAMGEAVAQEVVATFQPEQTYTLELFMGNPTNPGALSYWQGVHSVLQPYIEEGVVQALSGRLEFEDACIADGKAETAAAICVSRLKAYYADTALNICITGTDTIADGIISALEKEGYTPENWPIITGSGNYDAPVVREQVAFTAYTQPDRMSQLCVSLVDAAISGNSPKLTEELTEISNNSTAVPTVLCDFQLVKKQ